MTDISAKTMSTQDAWIGSEIQAQDTWKYLFTDDDVMELSAALDNARQENSEMRNWNRDSFPLPTLARKIQGWLKALNNGLGFILLKGFPVDRFSKEECGLIYWGMGLHMGTAVSQNTDGDLLGHVRDVGADPNAYGVRLYKTRAEQDFHTDGADIIGLFCLRAAKSGGISRIVSSVSIYNEILKREPTLVPTLFEPFPFDTQNQHGEGQNPWFELPICRLQENRLRTFFVPWYIRESQQHQQAPRLSTQQTAVIELIEQIANDKKFYLDMHFEPGDIQFLKNASILHKRTEYQDWQDPEEKRHLLRLWLNSRQTSGENDILNRGIQSNKTATG